MSIVVALALVVSAGCKKNALEMCQSATSCEIECPKGTKVHTVTFDSLDHPDKALLELSIGEKLGEKDLGSSFKYCARDDGKTPHGQFAGFDPSGERIHFHQMKNGSPKYGGFKEMGKVMDETGKLIEVSDYAMKVESATGDQAAIQGNIDKAMGATEAKTAKEEAASAVKQIEAEIAALQKVKLDITELQPIHGLLVQALTIQLEAMKSFAETVDDATLRAKQKELQEALEGFSLKEKEFEKAMEKYLASMGEDFETIAKDMEKLGAGMEELGTQLDKELGAAVEEINKELDKTSKEMGAATEKINEELDKASKEMGAATEKINEELGKATDKIDEANEQMKEPLESGGAASEGRSTER